MNDRAIKILIIGLILLMVSINSLAQGNKVNAPLELLNQGSREFNLEKLTQAEKIFRELVRKEPKDFMHHYLLSRVYEEMINIFTD